jgi:hypothetical protein
MEPLAAALFFAAVNYRRKSMNASHVALIQRAGPWWWNPPLGTTIFVNGLARTG